MPPICPGRPSNIETALSEALYLTAVERNGDIVSMTSYAPLLAKGRHIQWSPDLIYFDNTEVKPTVGYYTQLMLSLIHISEPTRLRRKSASAHRL